MTPTITYSYDEARSGFYNKGRLTAVSTAVGAGTQNTPATEQIYDFDLMGQVVRHEQKLDNQSYLIEYTYNLAGQLSTEKYPSGRVVSIGYDDNGRLSSVADDTRSYLNGVTFGANTLLDELNLGNGTVHTFGFNDRLQLTSQNLTRGSEVIQKYEYGYGEIDGSGNLNTTKNNGQLGRIESYIGTAKQWTQKFKYDSIGRISEAAEYRGDTSALSYKQKFEFDNFGNLYRKVTSNPTTGQDTPIFFEPIESSDIDKATNRLSTDSGAVYDDAGQVVTDGKFRGMDFGYDANGRMVRASKASYPDATTLYDALGNRVATEINNIWELVIYDAFGKLVAEYGGGELIDEGGVSYVLSDYQGSIRGVINSGGFVKSRADYQALGGKVPSGIGIRTSAQGYQSEASTRQAYGLTEGDKGTGLRHTWFRKLESQAGRWTSSDPYNGSMRLQNPQSFNRYSYVDNRPTDFVDPSGLLLMTLAQRGRIHCRVVGYENDQPITFCYSVDDTWYARDPGSGFEEFSAGGGTLPQDGCAIVWQLPSKGDGFVAKGNTARKNQYGLNSTIAAMERFAQEWADLGHESTIRYGEISQLGGGQFGAHKGSAHKFGLGADIGLFRKDGLDRGGNSVYGDSNYDRQATEDLINHLLDDPNVERVIFGDKNFTPRKNSSKYKFDPSSVHRNHIHVEFKNPCKK